MRSFMSRISSSTKRKSIELAKELGCSWDEVTRILEPPRGWTFFGAHAVYVDVDDWVSTYTSLRFIQKNGFQRCCARPCNTCAERPSPLRLVKE